MKKVVSLLLVSALALVAALSLSACGEEKPESSGGFAGIANPWIETNAEGIRTALGVTFSEPEEGQSFVYRLHSAAGLAEMTVILEGGETLTARMQATDWLEDISGMYYGWENPTDSSVFAGKLEGKEMRCTDSAGEAVVGLWYDNARGMTYCLSGVSENPLSLAIAENIFPVG